MLCPVLSTKVWELHGATGVTGAGRHSAAAATHPLMRPDTQEGSAVRDDFDEATSEFDGATALPALDRYFGLKEDLEGLFERPVDLVMPNAVRNP